MNTKSTLLALAIAVTGIGTTGTVSAQLSGLKQFDPTNKNSRVRKQLGKLDKSRRAAGRNLANGYKEAHGVTNPLNSNSTAFRGSTKTRFSYAITNRTSISVRFRLPGGKTYTLRPGWQGNYSFSGYLPTARIHVYNTGRTYKLKPGMHKFWTMKNGAVGLDMNYKQTSTSKSSKTKAGQQSNNSSNRRISPSVSAKKRFSESAKKRFSERFSYAITNRTSISVRFRLPSGKTYTLRPGQRGNYSFSGYAPTARIHVFNTGRTYKLKPGMHKFWTMKNGTVGLDMN